MILDGKIIESDRVAGAKISKEGREIDLWYSGKTHDFGGNMQALMDPRGIPRWIRRPPRLRARSDRRA